ncbi:RNase MRP subunit [Yamadazyma tenuis]|nr:RNase MRP subunit [Yamadazyma tenuis]
MLLTRLKRIVKDPIKKNVTVLYQKKIINKCFYEFYGIIKLGQFMSLGLVLVASLSKINEILKAYTELRVPTQIDQQNIYLQDSDDIGEVITEHIGETITKSEGLSIGKTELMKTKDKHLKKDKKKKKKTKSDIDKIFG